MSEDGHGLGGGECLGPKDAKNADDEEAHHFLAFGFTIVKKFVFYTNEIGAQEASNL